MNSFFYWPLVGLASVLIISCSPPRVSDQTIVRLEHLEDVNPKPTDRNYLKINSAHKILVAEFDTGVDYNHPSLLDNFHFNLNDKGLPVGIGKDYLGLDSWASYRIEATQTYASKQLDHLDVTRKQKIYGRLSEAEYDKKVLSDSGSLECLRSVFLKTSPSLEKFLGKLRDWKSEEDYDHGTHVAGLIGQKNQEIGIIPYRLLPYHENEEDKLNNLTSIGKLLEYYKQAATHARSQGVRIINISLQVAFNLADDPSRQEREEFEALNRMMKAGIDQVYRENPNILFVAAAGNSKGWSDGETRVQYPCGLDAPNVLCVGALSRDFNLSTFTTVPLNVSNLVFAPGYEVLSTVPHDFCKELDSKINKMEYEKGCVLNESGQAYEFNYATLGLLKNSIASLEKECGRAPLAKYSGTSMAAPLVANFAAKLLIKEPTLTPAQLITKIKSLSEEKRLTGFTLYKLRLPLPTW